MRQVHTKLIGLLLAGALGGGCAAKAAPLRPTGAPPLDVPEPPSRVVVPTPEPQIAPPIEEPPAPATAKPPRARETVTPPPKPAATPPATDPPATAPPVAPVVPAPVPVLSTPADTADNERRVRDQLSAAQRDLSRVNRQSLGADARAHYDSAVGFIRQAEEALKVKNLVYAGQLAEKAATMAARLPRT